MVQIIQTYIFNRQYHTGQDSVTMPVMPLFIFLIFSFTNFSKATNVTGFEFKDNLGTKYVTEENGVAEIKIKGVFK